MPDAELVISSYNKFPKNEDDISMKKIIDNMYKEIYNILYTSGVYNKLLLFLVKNNNKYIKHFCSLINEYKEKKDLQEKNFDAQLQGKLKESFKGLNNLEKIKLGEQTCQNTSYPLTKNKVCIKLSEGDNLSLCTFTGNTLDVLLGLLYILENN